MIDNHCLHSLPAREFAAGMAEVIKYGIIADAPFFAWLEENMEKLQALDGDALNYAIKRCCQIKADVVAADEKESGVRALLNLGHTFGHAIEAQMGYGNWLHGEAVAVGTVQAARTAHYQGLLSEADVERIIRLLEKAKLPVQGPAEMDFDAYMKHMMRDKKVLAGQLRLILPTAIGAAQVVSGVTRSHFASGDQRLVPVHHHAHGCFSLFAGSGLTDPAAFPLAISYPFQLPSYSSHRTARCGENLAVATLSGTMGWCATTGIALVSSPTNRCAAPPFSSCSNSPLKRYLMSRIPSSIAWSGSLPILPSIW